VPFALHGYAAGFSIIEYDIIIVPSMAEEPMALTCLTGNPCITLPAGIAAAGVAPPSITFIGGKLYGEATITAFANKFQQITLISSSIRLCLQSES
jgi:Asp-tRNA(Asn)/Glu-tRNA(Gln) amidotransferase A subunit family amidase